MATNLLRKLFERIDAAAACAFEPRVQQYRGRLAAACLEHVAQALLHQVRAVEALVLAGDALEGRLPALRQVLGVLEQGVAAALHGLGPARRRLVAFPGAPATALDRIGLLDGSRVVPRLLADAVEQVGHPLHHVERVHHALGARAELGYDVGDPPRAVRRHDLHRCALLLAQQLEERAQHLLAVPLAAPDDAARVVVQDDRHVLEALLVARLVDADAGKAVEAVAGSCVEAVVDPLADRARALPVDAHELGDDAAAAVDAQPCHLVLEGVREARCAVRPGNGRGDDAVLGALDAKGRVFEVDHGRAEVERPPAARALRAVVDGRFAVAMRAAAALSLARGDADDELPFFRSHGFDGGAGDAEQRGEYPLSGHGDVLHSVGFLLTLKPYLRNPVPTCVFMLKPTHTYWRRALYSSIIARQVIINLMHPSFESWQIACQMMRNERTRLRSYLQWYPFIRLDRESWGTVSSETFYRFFIEDGSFVLAEDMRFVTKGCVQKEGASFRDSYLVSPVIYLYLLAFGIEYEKLYIEKRENELCLYAGDLHQKQGHYRKSYRVFCDSIKHESDQFDFCLKTDIANFFGSINVDGLIMRMQDLSNNAFSATDALYIKALLLYCGCGKFPTIQSHPTLSFLATKVYLCRIDLQLSSKLREMIDISDFKLVRYVDDLYIFFNLDDCADLVKTKHSLINIYADLLRDSGMILKQEKLSLMNASEVTSSVATVSFIDITGDSADDEIALDSIKLESTFLSIVQSINDGKYTQSDFQNAVNENFFVEKSTATPISIFRQCLYRSARLFKEDKVISALGQMLDKGNVALSFNTNEIVQCVLNTGSGDLVKQLLNNLFQSERNGTWCSLDSLIATAYLQHRGMQHKDLISLLDRREPSLARYCQVFCRESFAKLPLSDNERKLIALLKGDSASKVQYTFHLFHKLSLNAFEQASYYRAYFARVSSFIESKVNGKKHKWLYHERSLKALYADIEDAGEIIRNAESLRQNNPLVHASSKIIERHTYKSELDRMVASLDDLLEKKLKSIKVTSVE